MAKNEVTISSGIPLDSGFTHILFNLAAQGFEWIFVDYYGSGDEGSIDSVQLVPQGQLVIEDESAEWRQPKNQPEYLLEDDLKDMIENKAYEHVLNSAPDWYNNEGGGGKLYINLMDGSFHCEHYINYTQTEDSVITGKFGDN